MDSLGLSILMEPWEAGSWGTAKVPLTVPREDRPYLSFICTLFVCKINTHEENSLKYDSFLSEAEALRAVLLVPRLSQRGAGEEYDSGVSQTRSSHKQQRVSGLSFLNKQSNSGIPSTSFPGKRHEDVTSFDPVHTFLRFLGGVWY